MPAFPISHRIAILSLLIGLLAWLAAFPAAAAALVPDKATIAVGETTYVKLESGTAFAVRWTVGAELQILASDSDGATVKGVSGGIGVVNAKWLTGKKSTSITVTDIRAKPTTTGGRTGADVSDPDMHRIGELLNRYKDSLGALESRFTRQSGVIEAAKPNLDAGDQGRLVASAESFFRELAGMGYNLKDLQRFRANFMAAGSGGSPLFPGQGDWDRAFLGTERALMMGRAIQVQQLWQETLQDTFRDNPNAAVFGEIDIGSWVKMQLSGLGFPADIDFSSVAIDPALNRALVRRFEDKLRERTALDMVQADALLTAHGQATPDVFIGDWGKTFAELDMLKRSKWKVLRPVFDNGELVRIDTVERPGAQLFWEVAFRKLEAAQARSGGKLPHELPNPHQFEVDHPKMGLDKEPMLSLEMLRHGIHDIEHGPYTRGQQLIKMLKYAERSYFMNKKAVAESGFNPYDSNDPLLAEVADKVIRNKDNPDLVSDLLRGLAGEDITEANVDAVTDRLLARAKIAMHDNAARALAFRLAKIAKTDNEDTRQSDLDKLWHDLETEIRTYQDSVGHPPAVMVRTLELVKAVMEGKLPASELEAKSDELHRLLNDAYKLPDTVVDRIMVSDAYIKVRNLLRKLGWVETQVDKFVETARKKYPRGAQVHDAVKQLNDQLNKTTAGSGLLKTADWADNAFTVYEAYMGGGNPDEAVWNASLAMGRIGLQEAFPSLAIPLSIYDGFRSGSPKPVAMAVAFYYFPFAGQTYMVSQQLQRADVALRDAEFYGALGKVMAVTDFDGNDRIVRFHLMQSTGKQELDSADIPPGNRQAVVDLFSRPDSTFYTAANFRYWASLVPKQDDRFGRYEDKLQKLRRFFAYSEEVRYASLMLENFKGQSDKLPDDKYAAERQAALERMEQQLQSAVWIAMADMLESSAKSVRSSDLEAKVKKLEDDLDLGDSALGKGKGLVSGIKWEIRQNSNLWSGENPYAVGIVYEKYIKAYERVAAIRDEIILTLWNKNFGVDYPAAQSKPMKILLLGGRSGAPRLGGIPEADVALAEQTLASHRQRGDKIRGDLESALGRPLDDSRDRNHLSALGQIGFEWEHLLDDCPNRLNYQGSEETQNAMRDRQAKYKAYLAKLAEGRPRVFIEGDGLVTVGKPANLGVRSENLDAAAQKNVKYVWREEAMRGKLESKGDRAVFTSPAPGAYKVWVELQQTGKAAATKLAEAFHEIKVTDAAKIGLAIVGPNSGEVDRALSFSAEISQPEGFREGLRLEWSADGRRLGSGSSASFGASQPGAYRITLAAYRKDGDGKEVQVARAEHTVTLSAKPKDAKKEPETTGTPPGTATPTSPNGADGGRKVTDLARVACGNPTGVFDKEPFNGLQLRYGIGGVCVGPNKDSEGFTRSRGFDILGITGDTITVSGSSAPYKAACYSWAGSFWFQTEISLSVGDQTKTWSSPKPCDHKSDEAYRVSQPGHAFNLSLPVPRDKAEVGVSVSISQTFVNPRFGDRGLVVRGSGEQVREVAGAFPQGGKDGAPPPPALKATLEGPKEAVKFGQAITLTAQVEGGKPPYGYAWTGAAGNGASARLTAKKAGELTAEVAVSDSAGQTASATIKIKVEAPKVVLAGLPGKPVYGGNARLTVTGLPGLAVPAEAPTPAAAPQTAAASGSAQACTPGAICRDLCAVNYCSCICPPEEWKPGPAHCSAEEVASSKRLCRHHGKECYRCPDKAPPPPISAAPPPAPATRDDAGAPKYRMLWQSTPGLSFNPATSENGATTVKFDRMGVVKLWCEVQTEDNGAWVTLAETEQQTIEVVAPSFSLVFNPADGQGKVGQEVRASVVAKPAVPADLIDYRWFDPASSNRMEYAAGEIGFKVKDTKPIALKALARVPHYGDEIAEITGAYTGVGYEVKIGEAKGTGPQLQVWVCDTQFGNARNCGMKPIPQGQFATFQDIFLKAQVSPAPPSPRYRWSVDPAGSCGQPGAGDELKLNCGNTGNYTVRLRLVDADDLTLGQAERTVSISVGGNDVKQAPRAKEAYDKMRQAEQNAQEGKLDEAIALATAAAGLDPNNTEAKQQGQRWSDERQRVLQQIDLAKEALRRNQPDEARKAIDAAKRLQPKYPPVLDVERQVADRRKTAATDVPTQTTGSYTPVAGSQVSSNQNETVTLDKLGIVGAKAIRLEISEASTLTASGKPDSARIGEVAFWSGGRRVPAGKISAESTYGGFAPEQAGDGDPAYRYLSQGARGWASADKRAGEATWLQFDFDVPVDIDRVVVTTAPSDPYRLHSFQLSVPGTGSRPQAGITDLAGTWSIVANGYTGKLEFSGAGGRLSGRVWYDVHRTWEELREIVFDGRTLRFLRPGPSQRYTGVLSGNEVRGSFDQGGAGNYAWSISRIGPVAGGDGAAVDIAGKWRNSDSTMTLHQSGRSVTGSYTNDGGEIVGELNGNVLEGWWIENGANERCATARNGRYYWGRIRWTFSGDKFTGAWGYCDKPPTSGDWNGERIGAAPTGAIAGANLARGKPASQSSTSQWSRPDDAQGAVDGIVNGGYGFHTNHEANPWWQVDLGGNAAIEEVRLYNRQDCCGERARTVRILLSDDGRAWRTVYRHDGTLFGGKDGKPLKAPLGGASARYLRLQLNETNWFHLDEVEVMGRMSGAAATTTPVGRDYTVQRDQSQSGLAPPPGAAGMAGSSETSDELLNAIKSLKGLFGK